MSTFDPFDIRNAGIPNDEVTRQLRERYAAPTGEYWDGLEARIMAAVTAGRTAVTDAGEWWQVLAGWARGGLVAASLAAVIAGTAALQARDAAADDALDPLTNAAATPLSRAGTVLPEAEELLSADGRGRRRRARALESADSLRAADDARREATFRYVMPF